MIPCIMFLVSLHSLTYPSISQRVLPDSAIARSSCFREMREAIRYSAWLSSSWTAWEKSGWGWQHKRRVPILNISRLQVEE
jgi:hypothetical protein